MRFILCISLLVIPTMVWGAPPVDKATCSTAGGQWVATATEKGCMVVRLVWLDVKLGLRAKPFKVGLGVILQREQQKQNCFFFQFN